MVESINPWSGRTTAGSTGALETSNILADSSYPKLPESQFSTKTEQFQVIWRQISFEVEADARDRLLNRIKSIWHLGGLTDRKDKAIDETEVVALQNQLMQPDWPSKNRIIFYNLSGHFSSGEVTAILGPSGAGKTSLLNAICGQVEGFRGTLRLVGGGERKMRLSIIPQKDYLMEYLTVRENLLFTSKILNAGDSFDHQANILRVVKMLNLTHCLDSGAAKISGGEYKRVSIGQELLRQPDILILDEPTSGLDSLNCKHLIQSLVKLIVASREGTIDPIAIVMTVHQPDVDIFHMFDRVYCMARGGRVIFDGHPSEVMDVIRKHSGLTESLVPAGRAQMSVNPASLLIEIASELVYGREPVERLSSYQLGQVERVIHQRYSSQGQHKDDFEDHRRSLGKAFAHSHVSPVASSSAKSMSSTRPIDMPAKGGKQAHLVRDRRLNARVSHSQQLMYQTKLLSQRAFLSATRDPMVLVVSLVFHLTVPLTMWIVYSQKIGSAAACPIIHRQMDMVSVLSNKTMDALEDRQSEISYALECSTMFFLYSNAFSTCSIAVAALAFPLNMQILLKEIRNGRYSLNSYALANTIASFPFEVLIPAGGIMLVCFLLGMPSSYLHWRLWAMVLVVALIGLISHTYGLVFGAMFMEDPQTAIFLALASLLPQVMISGFASRIYHLPELLQRLSWLSIHRLTSEAMNIIRFGFGICPCDSTTDEYLRTQAVSFKDIPDSINSLLAYYLANMSPTEFEDVALDETVANKSHSAAMRPIPGVSYDLTANASERRQLLDQFSTEQMDISARLADLMSRSFTYGRELDGCQSVRSQVLIENGSVPDDYLPVLFCAFFVLLLAYKLVLLAVVKHKIYDRV